MTTGHRPKLLACLALLAALAAMPAAQGPISWTTYAPMPDARHGSAYGVIDGRLYVVSGTSNFSSGGSSHHMYDPWADTWTPRSAPRAPRTYAATGVIERKLYVAGGCLNADCRTGTTNLLQVYDPDSDRWRTLAPMPTARNYAAAAVVDGKLYVTGGQGACQPCNYVRSTEVYDPITNTWDTSRTPIVYPQGETVGVALDRKVYVIGGWNGTYTGTVQVYDVDSDTWGLAQSLPTPRANIGAAVLDGLIYTFGGVTRMGVSSRVEAFNPLTGTWTVEGSLPTPRGRAVAAVLGGRLHVVAGTVSLGGAATGVNEAFGTLLDDPPPPPPPPAPENHPPVADAGREYAVTIGEGLSLDGSGSSDPDPGDVLHYEWTINGTLRVSGVDPVLTAEQVRTLPLGRNTVELTVTDQWGDADTASTALTVRNVLVSISVSPSSATLNAGESRRLEATGHYSDGTTQTLPSAGGGPGGMGANRPIWSVQFVSSQLDVSACDGSTDPRTTFASQALIDVDGQVHETWSPGTPILAVDGTIDATMVSLSLACTNGAAAGAIHAQWAGTRYQGTFTFAGATGTVDITGWSRQAPLPEGRFSLAAATVDGVVYALGGGNPSLPSIVYAYAPTTNAWAPVTQLPTSREGAGAAVVNGRIYLVGGNVAGGVPSGVVEAYEPSTNTWITGLQPMPTPRAHLAVVTDGTHVYAIGGDTLGSGGGRLGTVERYRPSTNTWETLAPMPSAGNFLAGGMLDWTIVIVGASATGGLSDITYIYDIGSNRWRTGPRMPQAKSMMAAAVANGGLYVVGGSGVSPYSTFVYYPPVETLNGARPEYWSGPASILTSRSQLAAAAVGDVIYAIGGTVPGLNPTTVLNTTEAFSTPPVNTFAPNGPGDSLPSVLWESTNTTVASVDSGGNVRGNRGGQTTIVASTATGISCLTTNTCATVTVAGDTKPPSLSLPNSVTREAQNSAGAVVGYFASATDAIDGPVPIFCNPQPNSLFPLGTTTVTCRATDSSGNTAEGSFPVLVRDTRPPFLSVPGGITEQADDSSGAIVNYFVSAFDQVDGPRPVSCTPASGSLFPVGTTSVQCSASDTRGNAASRSFTVTVTPPPTPAEMTSRLLEKVIGIGFEQAVGLLQSVIARDPARDGGDPAACGKLAAFINQLEAQSGKQVPAAIAPFGIAEANRIRKAIGCR